MPTSNLQHIHTNTRTHAHAHAHTHTHAHAHTHTHTNDKPTSMSYLDAVYRSAVARDGALVLPPAWLLEMVAAFSASNRA